jgi:putative transposase
VLRPPVEPGQYLAIRYTERLAEIGAVGSVGSVGDSYDCEHRAVAAAVA